MPASIGQGPTIASGKADGLDLAPVFVAPFG
jgi:hypothetical protein